MDDGYNLCCENPDVQLSGGSDYISISNGC